MRHTIVIALAIVGLPALALAQSAPMTLAQALDYAAAHQPALMAAQEDVNEREGHLAVARAAQWPRLDAIWQSNVATVNNVFGQLLPQSVVPSISGPVLATAAARGAWSSATGGLLSWEPIDLGARGAAIRAAEVATTQIRAQEAWTRLDFEGRAAARFLNAAAAVLAVEVAEADAARRDVLVRAVRTLVDNQLRPGADLSRAEAERAAAGTRLIQAREAAQLTRIELARAIGLDGEITVDTRGVTAVATSINGVGDLAVHPLTLVQNATVDLAKAKSDEVRLSWRPRLLFQASVSARGSGADLTGNHDASVAGLALDRVNWASGVQFVLPNLFDWHAQRARVASADAALRAATARRADSLLTMNAEQRAAAARLEAARAIAANTPIQLAAARQSESQSRARYDAGLATVVEVADAQSLLAASEYEDQLARIRTWEAVLRSAIAHGDLAPFISAARGGSAP
jgi:outer membrane protein TolC